jgi:predicted AAA+ superfamily ATPase
VTRYVDLLVDLLLVRRLRPYHANVGKRLVKSPKVYVRDSGLVHALLDIGDLDRLAGHPVVGASWEGFVIETLVALLPDRVQPFFYRTAVGAEIDLLLERPDGTLWAIEIKSGLTARPRRGFFVACEDLRPAQAFVVYAGEERYPVAEGVEALGVREMAGLIAGV